MKISFAVAFIFLTLTVQSQTCFESISKIPDHSGIPKTLCVYSIKTELISGSDAGDIVFYKVKLDTDMGIIEDHIILNKTGEIKIIKWIQDVYLGICNGFQKTHLSFKFNMNSEIDSLNIEALHQYNEDQCHLETMITKVGYEAI